MHIIYIKSHCIKVNWTLFLSQSVPPDPSLSKTGAAAGMSVLVAGLSVENITMGCRNWNLQCYSVKDSWTAITESSIKLLRIVLY